MVEALVTTAPILRRLEPRLLGSLACTATLRAHEHGQVLLSETSTAGEPDGLLLLTVGWSTAVRSRPDGSRTVVAVCRPGEVVGIERLVRRPPPGLPSWVASGEGATARLPLVALRAAVARSQGAREELEHALAQRLAQAEELLADRLLSPDERLLRALARLSGGDRRIRGGPRGIPLTQGELGALVGTSRETVNRSLRRLASAGAVLVRGGRVVPLRHSGPIEIVRPAGRAEASVRGPTR